MKKTVLIASISGVAILAVAITAYIKHIMEELECLTIDYE